MSTPREYIRISTRKCLKNSILVKSVLPAIIFVITAGITLRCQPSDTRDVKLVRVENKERIDIIIDDALFTSY